MNNIAIIGCGSWGTALAEIFCRADKRVTIWARDKDLAETINTTHENNLYLPGTKLDRRLVATGKIKEAVKKADIVLLVTPAQYARAAMQSLRKVLPKSAAVISCSKGIEGGTGKLLSEVAAEELPEHAFGILSGPTFAHEAVRGMPSAATIAAQDMTQAITWSEALKSKAFRPYPAEDMIGAEIGGAVKNVIAIACGIVEGRKLGQNARAAVMTRGMAEIKRYGIARGAQADTFLGLSGIGDLTLTCNSMNSRNFSLGAALGEGRSLEEIISGRRTVAEGVATAASLSADAQARDVDMPICQGINAILHKSVPVGDVVEALLSRAVRPETT